MIKLLTLAIIYQDNKILLGMKKRGFGKGFWNGFGGKLQDGENVQDAIMREIKEEAGIVALDLKERGVLKFSVDNSDEILKVHLFSVTRFTGQVTESEEMKPQWFDQSGIPYNSMWPDDSHWLPIILKGKNVDCFFLFDKENNILKKQIREY